MSSPCRQPRERTPPPPGGDKSQQSTVVTNNLMTTKYQLNEEIDNEPIFILMDLIYLAVLATPYQ